MKIRIKGDSIRYRLTKSDVATLKNSGAVLEKTQFRAGKTFQYLIRIEKSITEPKAEFTRDGIVIFITPKQAEILTQSDEIGVYSTIENDNTEGLRIIIEKDLKCLDSTDEDQSDMYENPKVNC